jgi:2-oxoglutarate ferredoxin oxidoreductase subunit alpha
VALPDLDALPAIEPDFASAPNHVDEDGTETFWPYIRDAETLARPWAPPGLPGLEHRIGGLEKADGSGNVSYDGVNHERMVHLRRDKIAGIAKPTSRCSRSTTRRATPSSCWSAGARPTPPWPPA